MGNKKRCQRQLRVHIKCVPALDADERLSHAVDILLKAAARDTLQSKESQNTKKEEPPCQAPAEDAPTGGAEEENSHEST